jgi:CheY-like chemotaxis protein
VFVVSLPVEEGSTAEIAGVAAAPEPRTPVAEQPSADEGPPRVLVLDDEPSIRAFLAKALRAVGVEPIVTATGEEAIEAARTGPIAAVLCDYRMAGMSGTQAYERLVALRPELRGRFVFMSGDVLNPDLAAFAAANGVSILAKPFDLDTVQQSVRAIVAGRPMPG